jgi:DNA-binding protein HU-beta
VNRRDLVQAVSTQIGAERKEVDKMLKGFTDVVTAVVSKGEQVSISGFAKFVKVDRPARMGRNPQTQQPVRIKASKKARITPLKGFKDAVVKTNLAPKLERGVWPPAPAAKAPARKTTAARTTAAKTTAAKRTAKKAPASRATAKKAPARKTAAKKAPARKTAPASRSTAKKAPARKTAPAGRSTAKKAPARKAPAKKAPAKKATTARKTTARKTAARR